MHQFDKVEQVVVHKADDAEHIALHEEIIKNAEDILQALKLPYRVVQNCTGDMGQGKWRMYDIETWMPSRNAYGETHSGSALERLPGPPAEPPLPHRPAAATRAETAVLLHAEQHRHRLPARADRILEQYQKPTAA